MSKGIHTFKS